MVSASSAPVSHWSQWEGLPVSKKGKARLHRAYVRRLHLDNIKLKSYVQQLHEAIINDDEAAQESWTEAAPEALCASLPEMIKPLGQSQVMAVELAAATTHYQSLVAQLELDKRNLQQRSDLLQQLITEEGEQRLELMDNLQAAHQEIDQLSQQVVTLQGQVATLSTQVCCLHTELADAKAKAEERSSEAQSKLETQPSQAASTEQITPRQVFAIAEGIGLHLPTALAGNALGPNTPPAATAKPLHITAAPPSRLPVYGHITHTEQSAVADASMSGTPTPGSSSGGAASTKSKGRQSIHANRVADIINEITKGKRWPKVPPPSLVVTNSRRTLIQPAWRY